MRQLAGKDASAGGSTYSDFGGVDKSEERDDVGLFLVDLLSSSIDIGNKDELDKL
jgi:hypothetical protein